MERNLDPQQPRRFLQPLDPDLRYVKGSIIGIENASSLSPLERSMEFKDSRTAFNSEWFVAKLSKYAVACINARINGTIYFGVADDKSKTFSSHHGEISGVPIPKDKVQSKCMMVSGTYLYVHIIFLSVSTS